MEIQMFRNAFNRYTVSFFVALFILNAIAATVVYSIGLSTGYVGQLSWGWDQYVSALNGLFGGTGTLLALIGGLAIFAGAAAIAGWLAHHSHVTGAIIWFFIGAVLGGFLLFRVVDWNGISFGFLPVIVLIVFTAIEVGIANLIYARLHLIVLAAQPGAQTAAVPVAV